MLLSGATCDFGAQSATSEVASRVCVVFIKALMIRQNKFPYSKKEATAQLTDEVSEHKSCFYHRCSQGSIEIATNITVKASSI